MMPFIFLAVGTFLSDYQTSDFVLVSSAKSAADACGKGFIILFVLSNIQAVTSFSIFIIILLWLGSNCQIVIRKAQESKINRILPTANNTNHQDLFYIELSRME